MTDRSRADPPATRRVGFSAFAAPSSAPRAGTSERLTLRTLAMSLNLSTSAVSLVLDASAGAERIPAVTRERILAAAHAQAITDTLRRAGYDVLLATHHRRSDVFAARARLML